MAHVELEELGRALLVRDVHHEGAVLRDLRQGRHDPAPLGRLPEHRQLDVARRRLVMARRHDQRPASDQRDRRVAHLPGCASDLAVVAADLADVRDRPCVAVPRGLAAHRGIVLGAVQGRELDHRLVVLRGEFGEASDQNGVQRVALQAVGPVVRELRCVDLDGDQAPEPGDVARRELPVVPGLLALDQHHRLPAEVAESAGHDVRRLARHREDLVQLLAVVGEVGPDAARVTVRFEVEFCRIHR